MCSYNLFVGCWDVYGVRSVTLCFDLQRLTREVYKSHQPHFVSTYMYAPLLILCVWYSLCHRRWAVLTSVDFDLGQDDLWFSIPLTPKNSYVYNGLIYIINRNVGNLILQGKSPTLYCISNFRFDKSVCVKRYLLNLWGVLSSFVFHFVNTFQWVRLRGVYWTKFM